MIDILYDIVALVCVFLLIYVMQKTEHDRINKVDPMPLQWFRRLSFIGAALSLCYSITSEWQRSLPVLLLLAAAVGLLSVNAVALHLRTPPNSGRRLRNHAMRIARARLHHAIDRHHE